MKITILLDQTKQLGTIILSDQIILKYLKMASLISSEIR